MASKKLNDFKNRLIQNRGKSLDGKKIKGLINVEKNIEISEDNKKLRLDIICDDLTEETRDYLQLHCKSIVNYIDEYNIGDRIPISKCSDSMYDFKILSKENTDGVYFYNLITI